MATDQSHDRPLAAAIATATRSVHSKLNKLIIARLPLALPPRAADPAVYVSGLLHIAPIYITFEALWQNIVDAPPSPNPADSIADGYDPEIPPLDTGSILLPNGDRPKVHRPSVCKRVHSVLEHLHLPGLVRSSRLRADIRALTGWPDHVVEEQLRSVSQMGQLGEFISHIKRCVENKPHVLVAYSYILLMALFAGGRFIRAALESVGDQFWEAAPSPVKPTMRNCDSTKPSMGEPASQMSPEAVAAAGDTPHASHAMPLRFFHFATPMDGEDLKREFKQRLADSESILTAREKHDIVQEAVCIFNSMNLLVQQLDQVCADPEQDTDGDPTAYPTASMESLATLLSNPMGARLRDSVVVAKERSAKSSSKVSSSSDGSVCTIVKNRDKGPSSSSSSSHKEFSSLAEAYGHHPATYDVADMELCPGLPKSMRFDAALAKPTRNPHASYDGSAELAGSLKIASKTVHVTNWVVFLTFGAIILGALLTGRTAA